jgi:hypothetical protein
VSLSTAKVVGPADGKAGFLGSIGVRFMLDGGEVGDRFSLVEHPMSPWALGAAAPPSQRGRIQLRHRGAYGPAGFERFFAELVDLGGVAQAAPDQLRELCQRFALEMDPASVPDLIQRFGVRFPAEPLTQ